MAVVPVYNMITVPDSNLYMQTEVYRAMTGRAPVENEKVTVIVAKNEAPRRELESDSFYPIGVSGQIREINEQGYLVIRLVQRVNLDEVYVFPDKSIELPRGYGGSGLCGRRRPAHRNQGGAFVLLPRL